MTAKADSEGLQSVTPYLSINRAADAIDFYKKAFNAVEIYRLDAPGGVIGHAEIGIGDSRLFLADPCEEGGFRSPDQLGGSSVGLHVYVEDVDALYAQAVEAGAKALEPVEDKFYGDRTGRLEDPFGHVWFVATRKENLSPEEIARRARELFGG